VIVATSWELRDPALLLLALVVPVLWLLWRRSPGVVLFSDLRIVESGPRGWRVRLAGLPALLLAVAAISIAVALAGPRRGDATTRVSRDGIAIQMVIDRSGSMAALPANDPTKNRLQTLQEVFRRFLLGDGGSPRRPDDLIGAVAFARYPDSICPLTLDHASLALIVDDLEPILDESESATAIGDGLALAVERMREHPARSKVVVLLTDGSDNASLIDPLTAAQLAVDQGVRVYTIGAGRTGSVVYRFFDPGLQREREVERFERFDPSQLMEIAELTGGQYFAAEDEVALERVIREIDQLERSEITETRYLRYTEYFSSFLLLALVSLALGGLLGGTVLRRLP